MAVAWALDETAPGKEAALKGIEDDGALVPCLWWFELRNGLVVNERRGRLSESETARFLGRIAQMPITIDRSPDEAQMLSLARRHRLTVYDAAYLELALREGLPLATLDRALAGAAQTEGVLLIGG